MAAYDEFTAPFANPFAADDMYESIFELMTSRGEGGTPAPADSGGSDTFKNMVAYVREDSIRSKKSPEKSAKAKSRAVRSMLIANRDGVSPTVGLEDVDVGNIESDCHRRDDKIGIAY